MGHGIQSTLEMVADTMESFQLWWCISVSCEDLLLQDSWALGLQARVFRVRGFRVQGSGAQGLGFEASVRFLESLSRISPSFACTPDT